MSRLVLDTNVVVSAFLKPAANESRVLRLALSDYHQWIVSEVILEEYRQVLSRPKFKLKPKDLEGFFTALSDKSVLVKPKQRLYVSADDADNRFLECCETGNAQYLVTGNSKHFPPKWKETLVINAREWLEATLPF